MEKFEVKNILLTGSGGFVGRNLLESLSSKYKVLAPRSAELDLVDFDSVKGYFDSHKIDFVIHCASRGGVRGVEDENSVVDDNLKMFHNLEFCLRDRRMIFFGSGAQYDKSRDLVKIKESQLGESLPKDAYGYSKLFLAKEILETQNVLCLNIFGSYGRYEKPSRFPSDAINMNLNRNPILINKNVVFDYLYIDDLCKIVEFFVQNVPKHNLINITPTQSISLLNIAKIINKISDFQSEIIIKEDGMNFEYTGDNSVLLREIPNFEFTSYETGISNLYNFLAESVSKPV